MQPAKICVPIVASTGAELQQRCQMASAAAPDYLEWRVDYLENLEELPIILRWMQRNLTIPLIFTWRTQHEGGHEISREQYQWVVRQAVDSRVPAYLDLEFAGVDYDSLLQYAQAQGMPVIASWHDFALTPPAAELAERLEVMRQSGAEMVKVAVMPQTSRDVLRLLDVAADFSSRCAAPLIAIAMGELGIITRIGGALFGSTITFATVGAESAPGQLSVDRLRKIWKLAD